LTVSKVARNLKAYENQGTSFMSRNLKLLLPDELRAFVDKNSGDGTLYATPNEFVRAVLLEKKERLEAVAIRNAIVVGYQDALAGRVHTYDGDLRELMNKVIR
jgi:hypothetical protein